MNNDNLDLNLLYNRFEEHFELSYEDRSHRKVPPNLDPYDVCMVVPFAPKCVVWLSFYEEQDICVLIHIDRDRKPQASNIIQRKGSVNQRFYFGTMLYGSLLHEKTFIFEDLIQYMGTSTKMLTFGYKLALIEKFIVSCQESYPSIQFRLPISWMTTKTKPTNSIQIPYRIHHYQYRSTSKHAPIVKILLQDKVHHQEPQFQNNHCRNHCKFIVKADIQYDIYHLYNKKDNTFFDVAYIPDYKTSVFMNSIFRNIKENRNLDAIEESDDEEEFHNVCEDRFVDLKKTLEMEFEYLPKFKKWSPLLCK
jgi:hypothetical protein